jgi:hypothetical protein
MANIVHCDNSNFCKNNYCYALATEFVLNPPPMLPAHHTGIADSGSTGHYFEPDSPVANYNPQAPTEGVCVATSCPKHSVASATLASATALPLEALSGHVMPNFPHTLIGLGPFANQDCTIIFTQTAVTVYHQDGHPFLSDWQDETGLRLWHFPLTADAANFQDATGATAPQPPIPAPSHLWVPLKKSSIDGNRYLTIYESRFTLVLLLVVLASARGSFRAVCLPPGNWGSSHPCGNIAKCGEK